MKILFIMAQSIPSVSLPPLPPPGHLSGIKCKDPKVEPSVQMPHLWYKNKIVFSHKQAKKSKIDNIINNDAFNITLL